MAKAGSRGPGRPRHEPTPKQRKKVAEMIGFGIPQTDICKVIGISHVTLEKHYRHELDTGVAVANAAVAGSLYHMAVVDKIPSAAIWWSKARMGWKEQVQPIIDADKLARQLHEARKAIEETDGPDGTLDEA